MGRDEIPATGPFDDPMLLLVQFFLAAAPLVALAVFAVTRRADRNAVTKTAILAGLATLLFWGWYHAGAAGVSEGGSGLALLASPVMIGVLSVFVYWMVTGEEAE